MSDYCVVVADGARARLFSLREASAPGAGGPNLVEISDLTNTEAELGARELYSDTKPGRNAAPSGSSAHGYDDHRNYHRAEIERRFAKQIATEAAVVVGRERAGTLVVAAEKQMLSHLREVLSLPQTVCVCEVAKDLTKLAPQELHSHLAASNALPARRVPA